MSGFGRIMPRDKGALSLDLVIAVMAFLAGIALGAALIAERASADWQTGLAGRLTVQIVPSAKTKAPVDRQVAAALAVLNATRGVAHAEALSQHDTVELVRPWLGSNALIPELPLPRLIDVTLVPGEHVDLETMRQQLKAAAPDSNLDDHRRWLARLRALVRGILWSAYGVLALISLATAATVSFATRAGLAAHRDIVELLHQMGARGGFIARAFEWHYFLAALVAGGIGGGLAALFYLAASGLEAAGLEPVPFLPPLGLHVSELAWLLTIPVGASWIALITARLSVFGALSRIY
ncbi:MAG TPA: hypothetical protein VLC74_14225 [Rhizomicrobium sp.]|nr:hypothetical protein [Rhizomicrobium sp.]